MTITPTLLTHGIRTGTFTSASTAAINATSGSKILLAVAYRSQNLAGVTDEVPFITGAAQYWGPLERRLFDASSRMHAHLYQGYGNFTNEPINITTFLSRSLDGMYWAAIQLSADGTPYIIRTSQNANSSTALTSSFSEPYVESSNTVIAFALTDYFGNATWTSSVHFPNVVLETSSVQYSFHIAYSTASIESPMIATNTVEKVLFGIEAKDITYVPRIQGRYIKLQQPTASAINHYDVIDITEGVNRKLVAGVAMQTSYNIVSMSFNGTPMIHQTDLNKSNGDTRIQSWWYDIGDDIPAGNYPVTMSAEDSRQPYNAFWHQLTNARAGGPIRSGSLSNSIGTSTMRGGSLTGSLNSYGVGVVHTPRTASFHFNGILNGSDQADGAGGTNYRVGTVYGPIWTDNITKVENLFATTSPLQMMAVMLFAGAPAGKAVFSSNLSTNQFTYISQASNGSQFILNPL